jgi:hypothetical protein
LSQTRWEGPGEFGGGSEALPAYRTIAEDKLKPGEEPYGVSFQAGQRDQVRHFLGGTELIDLVVYQGELYAGNGYLQDVPGSDPTPGPQIFVLDSLAGQWREEHAFSEKMPSGAPRFLRVTVLKVVTFTTDGEGKVLPRPISMLLAGLESWGEGAVFTRDDRNGQWTETRLPLGSVRSIGQYKDPVTGTQRVFIGGGGHETGDGSRAAAVFSGTYQSAVPGRIRWDPVPELVAAKDDGEHSRVMAFVECNGKLYCAAKRGLYERAVNGLHPKWKRVFLARSLGAPFNSGMRGLTAIMNPEGCGQVILAALEGVPGTILRINPAIGTAVTELAIADFLEKQWGTRMPRAPNANLSAPNRRSAVEAAMRYITAAYNDMPLVEDQNGMLVNLIGLLAECPLPSERNSGWILIRDADARYSLLEIPSLRKPGPQFPVLSPDPSLRAIRTVLISPFPEDRDQVLYLGGFSADYPVHNTAWLYRVGIRTLLSGYQSQHKRGGHPR